MRIAYSVLRIDELLMIDVKLWTGNTENPCFKDLSANTRIYRS